MILLFICIHLSARILICFTMLYQQCFFNKVICYLVTPFYIVCSDKSQQHEPFERWHPPYRLRLGDWLHMLDGDPVSVFVIVIFKFNASAAFLF